MLSKDNTPSAKVFAEQRCRKADSGPNADKVTKHIELDKGEYWQVVEKTD